MKLKMAKNSIFAILLRSSWWISLSIALALTVLAYALLPPQYALVGAFSGLPFYVIAAIALWRQARQPSENRVADTAAALQDMAWPAFSATLGAAFQRDGCEVRRLDGGQADFELKRKDARAIVSARRWKAARTGVEPLRALFEASQRLDAGERIYVTLGDVSEPAARYATQHGVSFMRAQELAKLIPPELLRGGAAK